MNKKAIGIFDSGLGGVSLLRDALALLPRENFIYYGDNAHAPYGDRPEAEITSLTLQCAEYLMRHGAKAIVLACNTATATCIHRIRDSFNLPVVSVEPAIKPASLMAGSGKILMMATLATTKLERYLQLQQRMPDPERIINVACPGLVDRIERGIFEPGRFDDLFDRYLAPHSQMRIDAIVLGCTHYLFIKEALLEYMLRAQGRAVRFFDGNEATVRQLGRVLEEHDLLNSNGSGHVDFHTSGDTQFIRPIFDMLLQQPI